MAVQQHDPNFEGFRIRDDHRMFYRYAEERTGSNLCPIAVAINSFMAQLDPVNTQRAVTAIDEAGGVVQFLKGAPPDDNRFRRALRRMTTTVAAPPGMWKCPQCTFDNKNSAKTCKICGAARPKVEFVEEAGVGMEQDVLGDMLAHLPAKMPFTWRPDEAGDTKRATNLDGAIALNAPPRAFFDRLSATLTPKASVPIRIAGASGMGHFVVAVLFDGQVHIIDNQRMHNGRPRPTELGAWRASRPSLRAAGDSGAQAFAAAFADLAIIV